MPSFPALIGAHHNEFPRNPLVSRPSSRLAGVCQTQALVAIHSLTNVKIRGRPSVEWPVPRRLSNWAATWYEYLLARPAGAFFDCVKLRKGGSKADGSDTLL